MRKGKLMGKIFGIALVFLMIGAMLGGFPFTPSSVTAQADEIVYHFDPNNGDTDLGYNGNSPWGVSLDTLPLYNGYHLPASEGYIAYEDQYDAFAEESEYGFGYYINSQWPDEAHWSWDGSYVGDGSGLPPGVEWHAGTGDRNPNPMKVLVYAPWSGKSCIAVIGDSGPAPWTGRQFGVSDKVFDALDLPASYTRADDTTFSRGNPNPGHAPNSDTNPEDYPVIKYEDNPYWVEFSWADPSLPPGPVTGKTWYVDDDLADYPTADFTTIQEAVDAASPGDTIIVYPGTYTENVDVNKDHLTIRSENGADSTIVQAASPYRSVFLISGDYTKIAGFTVVRHNRGEGWIGAIHLGTLGDRGGVKNCYISNNVISGDTLAGIFLGASSNNTLTKNTVVNGRDGFYLDYGSHANILHGNNISENIRGIYLRGTYDNTVISNTIARNEVGIAFESSAHIIYLNNFIDNRVSTEWLRPGNTWNSPEEITYTYNGKAYTSYLGNYWDDYTGSDADGDGIGDTPYAINSDNDNYPLIEPFENYEVLEAKTAHYTIRTEFQIFHSISDDGDISSDSKALTYSAVAVQLSEQQLLMTDRLPSGTSLGSVQVYPPDCASYFYNKNTGDLRINMDFSQSPPRPYNEIFVRFYNVEIPDFAEPVTLAPAPRFSRIVEDGTHDELQVTSAISQFEVVPEIGATKKLSNTQIFLIVGNIGGDDRVTLLSYNPEPYASFPHENEVDWIYPASIISFPQHEAIFYVKEADALPGYNTIWVVYHGMILRTGDFTVTSTGPLDSFEINHMTSFGYHNHWQTTLNQPPVVSFTCSQENPFSGDVVSFDASSSYDPDGTIVSYEWNFGDGETATSQQVTHRFRGAMAEAKECTVKLTIEDDKGATNSNTHTVTVYPLNRYIPVYSSLCQFLPPPVPTIMEVVVYYNWVDEKDGQDEYIVSEVHLGNEESLNFALYMFSIEDEGEKVWSKIHKGVGKEDVSFTYPFGVPRDCVKSIGDEHFEGLALGPNGKLNFVVHGVELGLELRPSFFRVSRTIELGPGKQTELPPICPDGTPGIVAAVASPVELRVYDFDGNVTGLVDGEIREEIPNSMYDGQSGTCVIFSPEDIDSNRYEIAGTDEGSYGLGVTSVEDGEATAFATADVPTTSGAIHQYTIDWDALSEGEEGVTVQVDSDGDGEFEHTFTSDDELTHDEFILQTATPLPMSEFEIEHAKIDFKKKPDDDKVRVQGKLEPDFVNGDGLDVSEDVIVTVGPLSETITMVEKGKKDEKWQYKRPKGGIGNIKHMTINWKNGKFDIRMDKADLSEVTNPVTISVQIGDDLGEETITMRVKKHHWDYKAK